MDQRWTSPWSSVASGAVITIITAACLINLLLYGHDKAHYALYYLLQLGSGGGPQILNWISELTGDDNEKRSICVALGNDLAYVVRAVAPNFVWKATSFPRAQKGMSGSIGLSTLLIFYTFFILYLVNRGAKILQAKADGDQETTTSPRSGSETTDSKEGSLNFDIHAVEFKVDTTGNKKE